MEEHKKDGRKLMPPDGKKKKKKSPIQTKSGAYQTLLVTYPFLLVYRYRPPDGLSSKATHFKSRKLFPTKIRSGTRAW